MMKKIQLLGTEEDLDNGFYELMNCGRGITCLEDETYIIPEEVIELLKKKGIKHSEDIKKEN